MNPGSTCLGPPSAHAIFLTVSLYPSNSNPWGARQSPAALGGQGTVSKETQESPLWASCTIFHQPYLQHPGCRYLPANPRVSLVACTLQPEATSGLPSATSLAVAAPEAEYSSCWHLPFLRLQEGVLCQHHTTTPATGALGNVGIWESNQTQRLTFVGRRGFCRDGLMLSLSAPEAKTFPDACWEP